MDKIITTGIISALLGIGVTVSLTEGPQRLPGITTYYEKIDEKTVQVITVYTDVQIQSIDTLNAKIATLDAALATQPNDPLLTATKTHWEAVKSEADLVGVKGDRVIDPIDPVEEPIK